MTERTRHLLAALTGLGLGVLALGPALAPGFVLSYDMVFVPDPGFSRLSFGLTGTVPRNVPSDAFATLLSTVLPGGTAQQLLLLSIFVMACVSAASLVPTDRLLPRLAAGVCYAWNPFVAERMLLGQWALLLGYAALPWVVAAAAQVGKHHGGRRLVLALIPAAIGGFAALTISALAALIVTLATDRRGVWRTGVAVLVLGLPWLVAGWLRPGGVPSDGAAVEAFASRADTPFGTLGSLLMLGGVWNGETVPSGYGVPVLAVLWLLVVVAAMVAYGIWCRVEWARGLAIAAGAGFVLAALGAMVPGLLKGMIEVWPGFAVLRDGQQYVAPLAVLVAVGAGLAVEQVGRRLPVFAAACLVLVPVVLLPSLAWGAAGRLQAVDYPAGWARAKKIIEADPVAGDVLVLPWAAYRDYPWNGHRRVLDPLPRYLHRRVIINDAVQVGETAVPAEDPRVRRLDPVVRSGGELTGALRGEGVRYVFVDVPADAPAPDRLAGAERMMQDDDVALYRISGPAKVRDRSAPVVIVTLAWIVTLATIFWSLVVSGITVVPHTPRTPRRRKAP